MLAPEVLQSSSCSRHKGLAEGHEKIIKNDRIVDIWKGPIHSSSRKAYGGCVERIERKLGRGEQKEEKIGCGILAGLYKDF